MNTPLDGALSVSTNTPSVVAKPVSCSSVRAFLIEVLDWSAQLIGSLSIFDPVSSTRPRMGSAIAKITSGMHGHSRQAAEAVDRCLDPALDRFLGGRRAPLRAPINVVGTTTPAISRATMPIDSSTPKSCTIGTFEIFTVRNAMTAAIVAATSGGPMCNSVASNGLPECSRPRSSSIRFWIWIANSMPRPMRIGRPAIVTSDNLVPVKPNAPKPQAMPTTIPTSGSSRQRTLNATSRITIITSTAIPPSTNMPPCR